MVVPLWDNIYFQAFPGACNLKLCSLEVSPCGILRKCPAVQAPDVQIHGTSRPCMKLTLMAKIHMHFSESFQFLTALLRLPYNCCICLKVHSFGRVLTD